MPSKKSSKKPQIRLCRNCKKIGHNRSTCPEFKRIPKTSSSSSTLKFFIHHVNVPPPTSPHVVNLKKESINELWNIVESSSPEKSSNIFHTYHSHQSSSGEGKEIRSDLFADLKRDHPLQLDLGEETKESKIKFKTDPSKKVWDEDKIMKIAKSTVAFALLVSTAFILPSSAKGYYHSLNRTKTVVVENSTAGFLALQESTAALQSGSISDAESATKNALGKFNTALSTLDSKHTVLQNILALVPFLNGEIMSRQKILLAGHEIAVGNSYLLSALKTMESSDLPFTNKLDILVDALSAANPNYEKAVNNLGDIDLNSLPFEYQEQFEDFRLLFTNLVEDFKNFSNLNDSFQEIFGGMGRRRYLLAFQNPHELRPTGGFIGSFAMIDVKDGKILSIEVPPGGSYDLQGQLPDHLIPPLPLTLTNKRWEFQDANWYPDFPSSAEKLLWFYNRSRHITADGVIAINAGVLEKILGVIGPVSDQRRGLNLSSENVITTIQAIVEDGAEKKVGKPKQILADLAPQILSNLQAVSPKSFLPLLAILDSSLKEKEIQAYFTDANTQRTIASLGWGGKVLDVPARSDYLMVSVANLQGQKSDAKIRQKISHQAVIEEDGTVVDTVIITREHTGVAGEKYYGVPNVSYIRIYVPEGSILASASGFTWPPEKGFRAPDKWAKPDDSLLKIEAQVGIDELSGTRITNEFDKTAFGNWIITEPGKTSEVQFTYRLPFKIIEQEKPGKNLLEKALHKFNEPLREYQLAVQKQSGITSEFETQIIFPELWSPIWQKGEKVVTARNGIKITAQPLQKDSVWSVIMKLKNN